LIKKRLEARMFNPRRLILVTLSLIVSMLYISACNRQPVEATVPSTLTPDASASTIQAPMVFPTPAPGLAVVRGRLVNSTTQKAPIEGNLFLGEIRSINNGKPIVRLERTTAPYAIPAPNGEFFFQNLEPGKYALIFYTPELNFLVDKPGSNESMIFDVLPDQVLDLGKIEITLP